MLSTLKRRWRSSGQRGSVLSALLIIIAFLSILGGALLNEISGQFLLTQTLSNRIAAQATVNASVESSIGQLQSRSVPSRCSTDQGAGVASAVNLNGSSAATDMTCMAIVPDAITQLASGAFSQDGTHVTVGGRNTYLVGTNRTLLDFPFGSANLMWSAPLGGIVSGQPNQTPDPTNSGHFITTVPVGNAVALVDDYTSGARQRCSMGSNGLVTAQPGFEQSKAGSSPFFPSYVFFGDSSGNLYAYDASTRGSCGQLASVSGLGGPVVAGPLALTGEQNGDTQCGAGGDFDSTNTLTVDLFAVVNASGTGRLVHYQYCEATGSGRSGGRIQTIYPMNDSKSLGLRTPVGAAYSSIIPSTASPIRVAVTSQAGQLATASIPASNGDGGLTYSISLGSVKPLAGSFNKAPNWSPAGDRIAAGDSAGKLYVLDTSLSVRLQYDDGGYPINTTPSADANGDWYFGADDGYIHDVEPPANGTVMFQAGLFGPVSPVTSSPVVGGSGDGCGGSTSPPAGLPGGRVCIYFGAGNGSELAQIGDVRVLDLRTHLTAGSGPSLWARVEVGDPTYVSGQGSLACPPSLLRCVHVLSWSYFHP